MTETTNEGKQYKFYLAASYRMRVLAEETSRNLEGLTGWKSCARWLEGRHDDAMPRLCADMDVADVREADAVIVMAGEFSRGGKWVEFGLAVGLRKPLCLIIGKNQRQKLLPVFAHLYNVPWFQTFHGAAIWLHDIRREKVFRDS